MRRAANVRAHNVAQRDYFESVEKRRMLPRASPYLERQIDKLIDFAELRRSQRLLEVGCGMGRYTLLLARRGFRIEGLDISPVLVQRLTEYAGRELQVPVHAADVVDFAESHAGEYDAVIGFFTLHHLHDLAMSFDAMRNLVRPGGRIAFVEPNPLNPLYYVQIAATPGMTWRGDRGLLQMRRRPVFAAMAAAGLERQVLERFGLFPPFVAELGWPRKIEEAAERVRAWRAVLPFQLFGASRPA